MSKCNHYYDDGTCAIIFNNKKWTGIYPRKIKGICKICKKNIEVTEKEYKDFLKEGELS